MAGKSKLYIATPCGRNFPYEYVRSITTTLLKLYDKYDLGVGLVESPLIYSNRNKLFAHAYRDKVDYMLFVDSDMDWTPAMVDALVEFDKDVVTGLCFSRKPLFGDRHVPAIMHRVDGEYRAYTDVPAEPCKIDASGLAFMLIKRNAIEKVTQNIPELGLPFDPLMASQIGTKHLGDHVVGEDISFSYRLQKCGFDIWCQPDVRVGHLVTTSLGKDA